MHKEGRRPAGTASTLETETAIGPCESEQEGLLSSAGQNELYGRLGFAACSPPGLEVSCEREGREPIR